MNGQTLLIFDLDGTLYRTSSSFLPTMHQVYDEFGVSRPTDEEILAQVGETYTDFLKWLAPQGFSVGKEKIGERVTEVELGSIATNGELFPGVRETLNALQESGFAIALCTNGDHRYATYVLETFGVLHLFDRLLTNDDDRRDKTEMIAGLLEEIHPERAYVIGDRYHDIEAGSANGCTTVGATYGYARRGELDRATFRIAEFGELLRILDADGRPTGSAG